jgi:hypothetical protein
MANGEAPLPWVALDVLTRPKARLNLAANGNE